MRLFLLVVLGSSTSVTWTIDVNIAPETRYEADGGVVVTPGTQQLDTEYGPVLTAESV
jgi:hypothetical protein